MRAAPLLFRLGGQCGEQDRNSYRKEEEDDDDFQQRHATLAARMGGSFHEPTATSMADAGAAAAMR